jgi:tRNA dimethylallyltransferase
VDSAETFSAGRFAERAHAEIDAALAADRRPIVVGGTGLYLQAALTDLELRPPPDPAIRARIQERLQSDGLEALHAELATSAPEVAAGIDPRDRTRVTRALELVEMGEDPAPTGADSRLWTANLRHPTVLVGLTMRREELYARIDARVDELIAAGAAQEVERAAAAGASPTARAALGFEELLAGDVEGMKRRTRNYARRQLAWMRRLQDVHEIDLSESSTLDAAADIGHILATRPGPAA